MTMLVCRQTKETYPAHQPIWKSPAGALLDLDFTPVFDLEKIRSRRPGLWRYREAIPLGSDTHIVSADEGFTPLLPLVFDGKTAWIKQEQLFSSGSYKDRGATVLMSKAKELGIMQVVQDSSGNAGCAIAMYAAMAGIACDIYVPADTAEAKLAQMELYRARIRKIPGSREDTAAAALEAARSHYYASHCWNPFFFHGTKTFAYEVCEQSDWEAPDAVVLPAGNGTLVIGCYIGFNELLNAGVITRMPKIVAVQSEHCAPLAQAFQKRENNYSLVNTAPTLAEGIAIAAPVRGNQIMEHVRQSGGHFITVSEQEIEDALLLCGRMGHYIEPTSAAAIAGLRKYLQHSGDEKVVSLFSGHGLKSTDKIRKILSNL